MDDEFVTIAEGARRLGDISDKTIRRAIHAGKLAVRRPQKNKAEISMADLQAWHSSRYVRSGETEDRIAALEARVDQLASELQSLRKQLEAIGTRKPVSQPPAELKLPDGHVWLSNFADLHYIPRNEAQRLYDLHAIHGQPISKSVKSPKYIAIGAKGRRDFWVQLHNHPEFRSCDNCSHDKEE